MSDDDISAVLSQYAGRDPEDHLRLAPEPQRYLPSEGGRLLAIRPEDLARKFGEIRNIERPAGFEHQDRPGGSVAEAVASGISPWYMGVSLGQSARHASDAYNEGDAASAVGHGTLAALGLAFGLAPVAGPAVRGLDHALTAGVRMMPDGLGAGGGKMVTPSRSLDSLGFYSQALEAAKNLKQAKGTPEQMLAQLKNAGVKDAEIEATGLGKLFEDPSMKGFPITRDEIVRHLEENRVGLREVNYGALTPKQVDAKYMEAHDNLGALGVNSELAHEMLTDVFSYGRDDPIPYDAISHGNLRVAEELRAFRKADDDTRWSSYSFDPSNPTYRETVLHLPANEEAAVRALRERMSQVPSSSPEWRALAVEQGRLMGIGGKSPNFQSDHWSEPNVVAHLRTSLERDQLGNPVYTINELQSDWGKKLRDGGVRDKAKIAGLKERADRTRESLDQFVRAYQEMLSEGDRAKTYAGDANDRLSQLSATGDRYGMEWRRLWNDANIASAELRTAEASTPGHPLVNTTDQWVNTALRRALMQAVDADAHSIAIPSGDAVLSFGMGGKPDGIKYAYDQMYPKNLRNILSKIDPASAKPNTGNLNGLDHAFTLFNLSPEARARIERGLPLFGFGAASVGIDPNDPIATVLRQYSDEGADQ